ncbi:MAG: DNA-binding domain-containing protein [Gammaproteobacteria bacterium]|nr:DNA-binding domain-containing protein [Gammaproteobacteria bacterium]
MKINFVPFSSPSPQLGDSSSPPDQPMLSAQAVIDKAGVANLVILARVRMGFPRETFALAAQPLIDGLAEFVQLQPVANSSQYNCSGGRVRRSLVTALRALDYRRGQILPRNAPPETLGALAHRWTYAVFAAALLRDLGTEQSEVSMRMFECWAPSVIHNWLGEDPALVAELRAALTGTAGRSNAIDELVERAAPGARPNTAVAVLPVAPALPIASAAETRLEMTGVVHEVAEPEFLDNLSTAGPEGPRRFMSWVHQGISNGSLPVNARGALVHGVEHGLLLVTPRIFREFIRHEGPGHDESNDAAKRLQRELLRAAWHLKAEGGVNFHVYAWKQHGRPTERIHGIVILAPERFFDQVPALNPALVRVNDLARAEER